jgi:soluble lytic murein transglycosylase-like protein
MTVQDQITQAAQAAGVPPQLALNIAQRESGFDNNAVGSKGEIGIFQLLPSTAAQLGVDPHDPVQNIAGGVAYIAQLLAMFGGAVQKAAAGFNCGPGCVQNAVSSLGTDTITVGGVTMPAWLAAVPASTQAYVAAVTAGFATGGPGGSTSPIIATGGASVSGGVQVPAFSTPAPDWEPFAWGGAALLAFLVLRQIGQS